jgi:hypothetical protein
VVVCPVPDPSSSCAISAARLGDVLPAVAQNGAPNLRVGNAILRTQVAIRDAAGSIARPQLAHEIIRQLCRPVALAEGARSFSVAAPGAPSPLLRAILHVVRLRAQEQVRGVTARRIVAAVANHQIVRHIAVRQLVRQAVRLRWYPRVP